MYVNKPVFPQKTDQSNKGYVRHLLGRMNRLKKMIVRRREKVLSEIRNKIDEVDKEIEKLQLKRDKFVSKKEVVLTEMKNIQTEINQFRETIKQLMDSGDISDFDLPSFDIRMKPSKRKGVVYEYYEGRVRGRMVSGRRSKDIYYQFGNYRKVRNTVLKERGIQLPPNPSDFNQRELQVLLEGILKDWWVEDLTRLGRTTI